jgi:uncharacterized membrane protein YjfL (UPF0719 family)
MTEASVILAISVSFVQLLIALVVAVAGSYGAYRLFSHLTKGINEAEELKKGNIAVGIVLLSVMVALGIVLQASLSGISSGIMYALKVGLMTPMGLIAIAIAFLQFVVGAVLAILAVLFSFHVFNRLTREVDEFAEIAKGNIAIALLMAGIAILTALVVQVGIAGITQALF